MSELWIIIFIFLISLASNALNGVLSGASSLFGVSLLLLLGIPPHLTMSTYTLGSLPARLSTMVGYRKSGEILWKYVPMLAMLGFTASIIGADILVHTGQKTIITIVGLALVVFIPLAFVRLKKTLAMLPFQGSDGLSAAFCILSWLPGRAFSPPGREFYACFCICISSDSPSLRQRRPKVLPGWRQPQAQRSSFWEAVS